MKKKMINSQISNFKTYNMYFRQMLTLAENVFEFKNLPEFVDVSFLNKNLLRKGSVAFFEEKDLGLIALPYNVIGTLDVYGRPNKIEVFGENSFHRILDRDEYVLMYDNNGRYPLYMDICQMAERIALCVRTIDINMIHQRTPRIWKTSQDKLLSVKNLVNNIDAMEEDVISYDSLDIEDLNAVLAPAPYVSDKIDLHLRELWAEFFRLIGVANLQEQKRERVIIDEMIASQGGTIASRFSRFEPRKNAVEKINKKFGVDIQIQYYDGEPTTEPEKEKKKMFPMFPLYPLVPNILKLGISHDEPPTIYALLNSYVNFANDTPAKIKDLANAGRAMFFDFDYPLATGMTKSEFECMILNHFMMRRIGYETVTAFKMALNVKLNEIMPMYNKLFESINGWNIFTDGEIMNRTASDTRNVSNAGTSSGTSTGTDSTTTTSTSDQRFSNTPQNALSDVRNGQYVSEYNYNQDSGSASSTSSNSTNTSTSNNTIEGGTQTEQITRTPTDKMHLYTEFLKNRQNIYTMIFKDLDPLFYQIV